MKKIYQGVLAVLIFGVGFICMNNATKTWADVTGLAQQTTASVNWPIGVYLCNATNPGSQGAGQVQNNPTCNNQGVLSMSTFFQWMASNVNWTDITGASLTGVVSNATFLKPTAS